MEVGHGRGQGWGCSCVLPSWENAENPGLQILIVYLYGWLLLLPHHYGQFLVLAWLP